eukprot:1296033-Pyramimonas_sp.AAC.1
MHSAIQTHLAKVFDAKPLHHQDMLHYLDSVFPQQPLRHLPLPDVDALQTAARLAGDSAPGPDGLPYRAWVHSEGSLD